MDSVIADMDGHLSIHYGAVDEYGKIFILAAVGFAHAGDYRGAGTLDGFCGVAGGGAGGALVTQKKTNSSVN